MTKKKYNKRKKNNQAKSRNNSEGLVFTQLVNSFAGLSQEVVGEILIEAGHSYEKEFNRSLERLVEKIRSVDVLHLLSVLAVYGLFVGMTETGKTSKKRNPIRNKLR
jgi:fucose permease